MSVIHCMPNISDYDSTFVHPISNAHNPLAIPFHYCGDVGIMVALTRRTPVPFEYYILQILYAQDKAQSLKYVPGY